MELQGVRLAFYHKSVLISIHILFYVIFHAFQVIQWAYIQASLSMLVVYLLIVVDLPYSRSTAKVYTSLFCFNVIDISFNIFHITIFTIIFKGQNSIILMCSMMKELTFPRFIS